VKPATFLSHVRAVVADRGDSYGDTFDQVAARWSLTLGAPVTAAQVCLCMIDLKMARLAHRAHLDGATDVAGYAALLAGIIDDEL
jgi:hypothetical protein